MLGAQAPSDLGDGGRDVEVKRRADAAEVRPLRHGLEMIHRLPRLDLDDPFEPLPPIRGRQDEIGEHLPVPDTHAGALFIADVDCNVVAPLQSCLQQSDDTVMLELFPDRPDQDGAHGASRRVVVNDWGQEMSARYPSAFRRLMYRRRRPPRGRELDADLFSSQNDAVIAPAENPLAPSAIRTILIVDDDRSVAETFARMLKLEGFNVATALSAEAGLELADSIRPSAIILDMRMPITNGLQFLRLARSRPHLADVPVAIVTGDYFLPDPLQLEISSLGASLRFKPMWLEDLIALAKTLVPA